VLLRCFWRFTINHLGRKSRPVVFHNPDLDGGQSLEVER
jgi:hypothetical protein